MPAVVEPLAAETGLAAWGARPGVSVAFLSRGEVARSEWHLPRPANRPLLELAVAGSELRLFGVHLTAVHSHPADAGYTFPTWSPHVRLDYVFLPATFADRIRDFRVVNDPAQALSAASDHLPVLAEIEP